MLLNNRDKILFIGDSVTDAGRKRPVGEGLWDGVYVAGKLYDLQVRTTDDVGYEEKLTEIKEKTGVGMLHCFSTLFIQL